ncbi:MAG TPA: HD domain-containing protein [Campylobacterales bacterium]|nr:HD domain-containing protein [Campylobacterales bacterium]
MDKSDIDKLQKFADGEISLSEEELREFAKTFIKQDTNLVTFTKENEEIKEQNRQAKIDIANLYSEIIQTQKELIYLMGEIGETRSRETGSHVKRVALYSYILAKEYGLSEAEAQLLKNASPMHDIGKVAIPDSILNKPGRLTLEEFEIMKTHSEIGYKLLNHSDRPLLKASAIVAYQHHERWDGKGYPRGLKGEEIHIFGRITAVADVFDALSSDRAYKRAWELDRILQLFKEEKGRHFEPKLVDIFFSNLDEFLKIRDKFKDVEGSPYKPC